VADDLSLLRSESCSRANLAIALGRLRDGVVLAGGDDFDLQRRGGVLTVGSDLRDDRVTFGGDHAWRAALDRLDV
jgi:hypothetical protein